MKRWPVWILSSEGTRMFARDVRVVQGFVASASDWRLSGGNEFLKVRLPNGTTWIKRSMLFDSREAAESTLALKVLCR